MRTFQKTQKQIEAINLFSNYTEVLSEGGGRAGKTFIEIYAMIARGLKHPGTKHLAVRKRFNHAKISLFHQTIPEVFKIAFKEVKNNQNKSDYYFEFGNGKIKSELWIAGTDDKERIEKILGTEWATIFLNEISEQSYETYELLKTRLNPPQGMRSLLLLDQNPPSMSHWSYQRFHMGIDPTNRQKIPELERNKMAVIKMLPKDNEKNLNENYLSMLAGLSESKRKRFEFGEYSNDAEGALWKMAWISSKRILEIPKNITRIIVAIDPNVTADKNINSNTDEAGIISVGKYRENNEDHYVVIRDDSTAGLSWGHEAVKVYKEIKADRIIAEVNQGGDLVEMNIRNYDKYIPYESVRATRGKEIRAEPVSDLYRRGYVHHLGELPELENELTTWIPGNIRSPNRLDALVWGISYLSGNGEARQINVAGW